jgi:hypothetical protein
MIRLSEERNWREEFEDIVDDPGQDPIEFYIEDEADVELGPAIAEGPSLLDVIERYREYQRQRDERDGYE